MMPLALAVPGDIMTLTGGYIYERRLLDALRLIGHDVRHIELPPTFPDPSQTDSAAAVAQLRTVGDQTPIIIDGLAFGSWPTADLATVCAPLIALIHHPLAKENGLSDARRDVLYRTERDNLAMAHHVLVPSPHTAEILMSDYGVAGGKITIVRPGTFPVQPAHSPLDPPMILSVGIQAPRKGHDVLLKALALIKDEAWQAVIVGSAHDAAFANKIANLTHRLGLNARVRLAGKVAHDALRGFYNQASIFALATRYEGYGIVFDEALSHGLPIVTCAVGAVPDTVPKRAGLLVGSDDAGAFAEALRSLLVDQSKRARLGQAALSAGRALPSWADAAQITSNALAQALPEIGG